MWPFECIGPDGRVYFHFDNWSRFLAARQEEYPAPFDHRRYELTLIFPREKLEQVFTPTGAMSHHDIQYHSSDWSTVFDIYPAHCFTPDGDNAKKIIIEDGHINPWGEPVTIMSDGVDLRNSNRNFAFFRGRYWKILVATNLTIMNLVLHPYDPTMLELDTRFE